MLAPVEHSKTDQTIMEMMRHSPLFSKLHESVLIHFAEKAQLRTVEKNKTIFIQGEEAEWFYYISSGWVKIFRETLDGHEAVIDVLSSGHFFGEATALGDDHYSYSAEAVEQTQLIALPTSLLHYHIEKTPQLAINMLSHMAQQRQLQTREIEHLNTQNATQRIGCFLLRLCPVDAKGEHQVHLPYDKTLIAARLNMKPETFSRALAKLKTDVNLAINGSSITISSIEGLINYTCSHCSNRFPCEVLKEKT